VNEVIGIKKLDINLINQEPGRSRQESRLEFARWVLMCMAVSCCDEDCVVALPPLNSHFEGKFLAPKHIPQSTPTPVYIHRSF
jgi:hypothetical protein